MTNFNSIKDLKKDIKSETTAFLAVAENGILSLSYYGGTDKKTVISELNGLKKKFPNSKLKGRKFFKIEIPYYYIDDEKMIKEHLHGYRWQA